ncbi:uncharacterized protein LOC130839544 [Hippopotamus amphibius kiboko]|uniref:uncharacterized protein LOC130839544 n=1 Tax=Hippopotamus amphibius kiboko TaxID=575201 RepID=UPI002597C6C2|nr:uncharacterized protein LOC130839544 [Hippopotamus amphibius kiboko]
MHNLISTTNYEQSGNDFLCLAGSGKIPKKKRFELGVGRMSRSWPDRDLGVRREFQRRALSSEPIVKRVVKWSWGPPCPVSHHGPQDFFPESQAAAPEVPSNLEAQGGRRGWKCWHIHPRKADHGTRVGLLLRNVKDAALRNPTAQLGDTRASALTRWGLAEMVSAPGSEAYECLVLLTGLAKQPSRICAFNTRGTDSHISGDEPLHLDCSFIRKHCSGSVGVLALLGSEESQRRLGMREEPRSHRDFLLQQCLDRHQHSSPSPVGRSEPAFAITSQRPPTTQGPRRRHRLCSAARRTTASPSQVRQNYHQDSEAAIHHRINLELYASYVYLSRSYYFDRDDVVLKNFAVYFLHQSREEREHAEKLMKLQNQWGGQILLQDVKKPDRDDWENELNATECALYLGKNVNQELLELHKLATDKNDPHLCDFIETHYLNEQVKSIKELGDHLTNLCKIGAPGSGTAEYLFDKHTLGNSDSKS